VEGMGNVPEAVDPILDSEEGMASGFEEDIGLEVLVGMEVDLEADHRSSCLEEDRMTLFDVEL